MLGGDGRANTKKKSERNQQARQHLPNWSDRFSSVGAAIAPTV